MATTWLYRHFSSKDDLIAAYLERANSEFMAWLEEAIASIEEPRAKLVATFEATAKLATSQRCLGCTFQAAVSEFPELDHPGHRVALEHKRAVLDRFTGLARQAGLRDPDGLAAQLLMLMDGAWVAARMFGRKTTPRPSPRPLRRSSRATCQSERGSRISAATG